MKVGVEASNLYLKSKIHPQKTSEVSYIFKFFQCTSVKKLRKINTMNLETLKLPCVKSGCFNEEHT